MLPSGAPRPDASKALLWRDAPRWQVSWLAGHRRSPPSRGSTPVAVDEWLAAHSCGGSAGLGAFPAPASLFTFEREGPSRAKLAVAPRSVNRGRDRHIHDVKQRIRPRREGFDGLFARRSFSEGGQPTLRPRRRSSRSCSWCSPATMGSPRRACRTIRRASPPPWSDVPGRPRQHECVRRRRQRRNTVVDAGVAAGLPPPDLIAAKVRPGTRNAAREPALTGGAKRRFSAASRSSPRRSPPAPRRSPSARWGSATPRPRR